MNCGGDGGSRSRPNVRCGASECSCGGYPTEEGRKEVTDTERNQLRIRIVFRVGHAVGDGRRQQRLDRAEQRNGESRGRKFTNVRKGESTRPPRETRQWRQTRN